MSHCTTGFGVQDIYEQGSIWEQYLLSFYWVVATLSTNGQIGNMTPKNMAEVRGQPFVASHC